MNLLEQWTQPVDDDGRAEESGVLAPNLVPSVATHAVSVVQRDDPVAHYALDPVLVIAEASRHGIRCRVVGECGRDRLGGSERVKDEVEHERAHPLPDASTLILTTEPGARAHLSQDRPLAAVHRLDADRNPVDENSEFENEILWRDLTAAAPLEREHAPRDLERSPGRPAVSERRGIWSVNAARGQVGQREQRLIVQPPQLQIAGLDPQAGRRPESYVVERALHPGSLAEPPTIERRQRGRYALRMTTSRDILWEGAFNAFDLGGVPLRDGNSTAWSRVYRLGRPETLTPGGWAAMRDAGVMTLIDLRNADERRRFDWDPEVDEVSRVGIDVVHAPTEDQTHDEFMSVCGPWLDHARSYPDNLRIFPQKFSAVFEALSEAPGPVAFHCAGGRDRTGMIAAMLLSLAGATTDGIVEDYTVAYRQASRHSARMKAEHPERPNEHVFTDDEIEGRIAERVAFLREWIDTYSVSDYLRDAGLSHLQVERLRELLR